MRALTWLLVALGLCLPAAHASAQDRSATIDFLDVGQGDAILVRSPEGKTALIDAGPSKEIVPELKRLGVKSIDLVVVSHHHADHYGVSVRRTASLKPGGDSSRWGQFLIPQRPHHGAVVPRNLLVGNPHGFPPLGTDSRRVLPAPPYLHPLLPGLALSAPTRTPCSSLTRWPPVLNPFLDPSRSARLPAGPCPSPTTGAHHGSSSRPTSSPAGTGPSDRCHLRVPAGFDPATLHQLLDVLEQRS